MVDTIREPIKKITLNENIEGYKNATTALPDSIPSGRGSR
jgi:hypothetical protein